MTGDYLDLLAQDIDDTAIERRIGGEPVKLTHPERREAVRRLHAQRLNDVQISELLAIHPRQVFRDRRRLDLASWPSVTWRPSRGRWA